MPTSHILAQPSSPESTDSASPASSTGLDAAHLPQLMPSDAHSRQHQQQQGTANRAIQQQQHNQAHPDKRKNGTQGAGAIKDSRRTSGGHHSHPTGEDGEISRSEYLRGLDSADGWTPGR